MQRDLEQLVWGRANRCCEYCRIPADVSLLPFQIDHIIAEKHGGLILGHRKTSHAHQDHCQARGNSDK
jgi:HNH endonuclease